MGFPGCSRAATEKLRSTIGYWLDKRVP